ncbi:uncharacterized protein LOC119661046 [Hermetia illucens]|nr:uncharacterized protein LOC119661046 [Hermetia illucens]
MVNIQLMTQQLLTLNIWLIVGIVIMLIRNRVNGQLTSLNGATGRNSDYGPTNGNSGSSGGGGGNGEVLLSKTSPLSAQEPTCEELRAMWRFSKRQSRAAEVTNEIPTYRDPFAYNIWEPYIATTRSIGGVRITPRYRDATRPVYGRILHREPLAIMDRNRAAIEDFSRGGYGLQDGSSSKMQSTEPRRRIQFRFAGYGPGVGGGNTQNLLTAHHGSFQKLKELIWTERARELATQRKAEELAARAATLKDVANGQNFAFRRQLQQQSVSMTDENRNPDAEHTGSIIALPGGGQKSSPVGPSIFSGKQSSGISGSAGETHSSLRSGGVLLPAGSSSSIGQLRTYGYRQPGASIFRERNRALYRQAIAPQSLPGEYYQRDLRKAADESRSDDDDDIVTNDEVYETDDGLPFVAEVKSLPSRHSNQFNIQDILESYYNQLNLNQDGHTLNLFY